MQQAYIIKCHKNMITNYEFAYLEIEFAARERQRESDSVRMHRTLVQHLHKSTKNAYIRMRIIVSLYFYFFLSAIY